VTENEIAKIIVDKVFKIHQAMGPGLLESFMKESLFMNWEILISK
jgi:hypothetical protein